MTAKERHSRILEILKENNVIRIREIAEAFDVSQETARRDLETLQEQNLVKRIHGGAILVSNGRGENSLYSSNASLSHAEKVAIGKKAATLVKNGETILLDTGSTVLEMARNLKKHKNLTVITSSLAVVDELIRTDVNIIMLGGDVKNDEQCVYSQDTEMMFDRYFVDKAFFSCGGITFTDGITDYGEILNRHKIAAHSAETILIADSGKFGRNARYKACPLELIDKIVVDNRISEQQLSELTKYNIEVILADVDENI